MRALQLTSTDSLGGAAIAARRLHEGLRKIGVDSRMIVAQKLTDASDIEAVEFTGRSLLGRLRRRIDAARLLRERRKFAGTESPRMVHFSDDRVAGDYILNQNLPAADVYNLHGISGFVDYRRFFGKLPVSTPLVWTLHDMSAFTGGCHYAFDCSRFTGKCGRCPQLGSQENDDLSAQIYARKVVAFARLSAESIRIVTPSRWLAAEASRSKLLNRFCIDVIPYGVDLEAFSPRRKETAREMFSIAPEDLVVAFVADRNSLRHKGFDLLRQALTDLNVGRPVTLVAIGHGAGISDAGNRFIGLGRIDNERVLSFALSAADLFVLPTRTDNLPNVILESMACGLPVVSFDVGGVPDMVRPGHTGLLAPAENVAALRQGMESLLSDDDLRARLSRECRKVAVAEYGLELQARRYHALYGNLIETSARFR